MTNRTTTTLAGGVLLSGCLALITPVAQSQNAPGNAPATSPGSAVDAAVADRDPRAASLRRVEPGNAQFSYENRLTVANFNAGWSPFNPATPTAIDPSTGLTHSQAYQYRSPGLRALIDRPEYARLRTGGELMVIPANTVFQLTLDRPATSIDPRPAAHENYRDQRLNLRSANTPGGNPPGKFSDNTQSGHTFGQAYPNLRLERIPISDLSPIPDASQMRFPQAAFPNGQTPSQPLVPVTRPRFIAPPPETPASPEALETPQTPATAQAASASEPAGPGDASNSSSPSAE